MTRRIGFSNVKVFLSDADFFGDDSNLVDVPYQEILVPSESVFIYTLSPQLMRLSLLCANIYTVIITKGSKRN
ncbi:hypothetical protein OCF17_26090 [Bacillus wiedmannii]|nr:hypothetical protein [Bacillus wiedmannii]MCU5578289.1 hypothetical protein [Bacillus wiedmannii]